MTQQQQTPQSDNLEQYQDSNQPIQAGRARIIYDSADQVTGEGVLDEDLGTEPVEQEVDLTDLQSEEADLDALASDLLTDEDTTEPEPEDDFTEGSPRFESFKQDFSKAFGIELNEAVELVQSLHTDRAQRAANEQKYELSAHWEVPVAKVEERLAIVAKLWQRLPADKQAQFDNPQGAIALWSRHETAAAKRTGLRSTQKTGSVGASTARTAFDFTEKQIDSMDAATYSANATAIALAYANKRVKR